MKFGGIVMRLRNKPYARTLVDSNPHIVIPNPNDHKGQWNKVFGNNQPIHIEVGTGRGRFLIGMAKKNPEINYIGLEKYTSVIVDALEKHLESDLPNLRFINIDAETLEDIFEQEEVSRVYLNFSDPWPKDRHAKRRLTGERFLKRYEKIIIKDGEIHFKTDNQPLFEFSIESMAAYGMILQNLSLDLHKSEFQKENIMTEYEEKFSSKGNRIYRVEAKYRNHK